MGQTSDVCRPPRRKLLCGFHDGAPPTVAHRRPLSATSANQQVAPEPKLRSSSSWSLHANGNAGRVVISICKLSSTGVRPSTTVSNDGVVGARRRQSQAIGHRISVAERTGCSPQIEQCVVVPGEERVTMNLPISPHAAEWSRTVLGKNLSTLKQGQLVQQWNSLFGADPPDRLRRPLMIQALAS